MSDAEVTPIRETLLRQCLAAEPAPWYPKDYAETAGVDRESLYAPLNDLRAANLVTLTDWVRGKGQGYVITPLGKDVLANPTFLAQLRDGKPTAPSAAKAEPAAPVTRFDIGEVARKAFFAENQPRIVPILLLANLIMFAVSLVVAHRNGVGAWHFLGSGDPIALDKAGAVTVEDLARGEWWRLITNCFLHYGLLHLTLNMFCLVLLARVESLWGPGRFLVLYLMCGICGACVGIYFRPAENDKVFCLAGASGALWGVMASQAVWLFLHRSHLPPEQVRRWAHQLFFTLVLNVGVSMLPSVSGAAHFGGGVAGAIAAVFLQMHRFGTTLQRAVAGLALALIPTIFLLGLATAFEYDHRLQPFLLKVHREQIDSRLGKLPPALDDLEPKAEKLHLQESAKRDSAELSRVRDGLRGLVKQTKEAHDWLDKWSPVSGAKGLKERGLILVNALVPYAEALDTFAGGVAVENMNELRNNWREARLAWTQAMAK
jgi:membrane associated rhomboid family serine protease